MLDPPRPLDDTRNSGGGGRQVELDVQRLTDLLHESQAMAKVGGWEIDLVADSLYWTDETYRIHDTSPAEYQPTVESAIAFYAPEAVPVIRAAVERSIRECCGFDLELELITARHYLQRIRLGAQRMGQLIDDLLNLSRINRRELEFVAVDLSGLCRQVLGELARADPERQVQVAIQPDLQVRADHRLLLVVLENLLGNAWKFTARRQDARIEVGEAAAAGGERCWFIRDNGAGFEMAYLGKLFQSFQRLHSASDYEGTGIGLAIVQRIILRHGGRVWAEAEPGAGATFSFTLPGA
jgi:signal transduction histidine kinase